MKAFVCLIFIISQVCISEITAPTPKPDSEEEGNGASAEVGPILENAERLRNRAVKTVGDIVEDSGSLLTGIIRLAHSVHETQASYTNAFSENIPGIGPLVSTFNAGVSWLFGGLRYGAKQGIKRQGSKVVDYAEDKRDELKEKKAKRIEERRKKRTPPKKKPEES